MQFFLFDLLFFMLCMMTMIEGKKWMVQLKRAIPSSHLESISKLTDPFSLNHLLRSHSPLHYDGDFVRVYMYPIPKVIFEVPDTTKHEEFHLWLQQQPFAEYIALVEDVRPIQYASNPITQEDVLSWGLDRLDQINLTNPKLDQKYIYSYSGTNTNMYIVDSGVRRTHIDMAGRVYRIFDGEPSMNDSSYYGDCAGHGTAVASVAAGTELGVAKSALIFDARIFDCDGYGSSDTVSAALNALVIHRANYPTRKCIINLSFANTEDSDPSEIVEADINAILDEHDCVVVAAAGNGAEDACTVSPARIPRVITVAASKYKIVEDETVDEFDTSYSNYGTCVDLIAPGTLIRLAYKTSDTSTVLGSGTSFAAPFVAGIAALVGERYPNYTSTSITNLVNSQYYMLNLVTQVQSPTPNKLAQSGTYGLHSENPVFIYPSFASRLYSPQTRTCMLGLILFFILIVL